MTNKMKNKEQMKIDNTNLAGVYTCKVNDLIVRIIENFTTIYNEVDRNYSDEIELAGNRIIFEVLSPKSKYDNPKFYPKYRKTLNDIQDYYKFNVFKLNKLSKFEFYNENYIRHNLDERMIILVNKNNKFEYDKLNDVYDLFEFKGNIFALIVVDAEFDIDEVEDFTFIRSIIKKAWKWYKSQVYIERFIPKEMQEGDFETERYLLQASSEDSWWVCTDKRYKIVVRWKEHLFNDTQEARELEDLGLSVTELSIAMREMGEWLRSNHYNKIF